MPDSASRLVVLQKEGCSYGAIIRKPSATSRDKVAKPDSSAARPRALDVFSARYLRAGGLVGVN